MPQGHIRRRECGRSPSSAMDYTGGDKGQGEESEAEAGALTSRSGTLMIMEWEGANRWVSTR